MSTGSTASIVGGKVLRKRLAAMSEGERILVALQTRTVVRAKHIWRREHKKTNLTINTIRAGYLSRTEAFVLAGGNAVFVELGTKPHIIRPRTKPLLSWQGDPSKRRLTGAARVKAYKSKDGWIYAAVVHHPGNKPMPFLSRAAQEVAAERGLKDIAIQIWNQAG